MGIQGIRVDPLILPDPLITIVIIPEPIPILTVAVAQEALVAVVVAAALL